MPNLDKTGPRGEGPTGLGRGGCGRCTGTRCTPGRGMGRGFSRGPNAPLTLDEEETLLEKRLAEVRAEKESQNT